MNAFHRATTPDLRPIPGLVGYEIDERGNVYSTRKRNERRRLRPGLATNGYLTVALYNKSYNIHTLMRLAFLDGQTGRTLVVNHKDGNKQNNKIDNLEVVTYAQNMLHAYATGLHKPIDMKGEQIGTARLTALQVTAIKSALANGESCASIGRAFGVDRTTISKIKNHNNWNHI